MGRLNLPNPLLLLLIHKLGPGYQDSCRCGRSHHGCSTTTKFLSCIARSHHGPRDYSLELYNISALLHNWYTIMMDVDVSFCDIYEEVKRFVAFTKLDLTHTCCEFEWYSDDDYFQISRLSDDNGTKVGEEEGNFLKHLENMSQEPDSHW